MSEGHGDLYSADTTPFAHYEGARLRLGVRVQSPLREIEKGIRAVNHRDSAPGADTVQYSGPESRLPIAVSRQEGPILGF